MKFKLFFLVLFIIAILYAIYHFSFSSGVRSGKLVKLSKKGLIFRTYEGTLDLGSGDKLTWDFSIRDDDIGDELIKNSGSFVKLEYKEYWINPFFETPYSITSWSLVNDTYSKYSNFCRLVNILRKDSKLVNTVRSMVVAQDGALLDHIRKCQSVP